MDVVLEVLKLYGPWAIWMPVAFYLGKFILDRYDAAIKAQVDLATALNALSKVIEDHFSDKR